VTAGGAGRAGRAGARRPAVFLDRDGTVVEEADFLADPAGVRLIPGAAAALRTLRARGYALVLVTNQSGIARGLFSEAQYRGVHGRLEALLAAEGVTLDGSYHCPHHPAHTGACTCRKPAPGLFLRAAEELGLDLAASVYVGDRLRDVEAGLALGGRAVLVHTGYGAGEADAAPPGVLHAASLAQVPEQIGGGAREREESGGKPGAGTAGRD
jgi:D-glycero-D-manno-heptose 1,7-bisphosphate phosphatase